MTNVMKSLSVLLMVVGMTFTIGCSNKCDELAEKMTAACEKTAEALPEEQRETVKSTCEAGAKAITDEGDNDACEAALKAMP